MVSVASLEPAWSTSAVWAFPALMNGGRARGERVAPGSWGSRKLPRAAGSPGDCSLAGPLSSSLLPQEPRARGMCRLRERKGPVTGGCPPGEGVSWSVPVRPKQHSVIFSVCHKQKQARVVRNVPKMSQRKRWVHPGLIAYPALGAAGLAQPRDGVAAGGEGGEAGPKAIQDGAGRGKNGDVLCQRGCPVSPPRMEHPLFPTCSPAVGWSRSGSGC